MNLRMSVLLDVDLPFTEFTEVRQEVAINTAFEGCSEVLTPVTMLIVLVARKEMQREGHSCTGRRDRALAHSLPANLSHISRLSNAAHPGWLQLVFLSCQLRL